MKERSKARYWLPTCLLGLTFIMTACSYLTDFVVVNATDSPIEIRYVVKKPVDPIPPRQALPIIPAIKSVSQLHHQIAWRELSPPQYTYDPDKHTVIVSLMPREALRIEQRNLVDGKVDDAHLAEKFQIEEIIITGSHGEVKLQGEQLRKMFAAESKKIHVLTYK